MLDSKGFDIWANSYDEKVSTTMGYPFDGYYDILTYIYNKVREGNAKIILDIGFGTGTITQKFYDDGLMIYGIDFSQRMVEIAQSKMKNAVLVNADVKKDLPNVIRNTHFDYIVSTYVFHHFNTEEKIHIISNLKRLLKPNGKIFIGDVSFKNKVDFYKYRTNHIDIWDDDEVYIVYEELVTLFKKIGLRPDYIQISPCAGVLLLHQ